MSDAAAENTRRRPFTAVVATLFPEIFPGPLGASLIGRALRDDVWRLKTLDFRDFASDKHRSVDAPPFGGGPGLVMRAEIVAAAADQARSILDDPGETSRVWAMSPRGRPFRQAAAEALAAGSGVALLCGRFEGFDARALEARGVEEVSVCDAVLMGGEVAAMMVLEATVRLLPGVVGAAASLEVESFSDGLLEHPHYTRPAVWEGRAVPEALLSGDHARIGAWRRAEAERVTRERRADLWGAYQRRGDAGPPDGADANETGPRRGGGRDDNGETR